MNYEEFVKKVKEIDTLSLDEQERYYLSVLDEYKDNSDIYVAAIFYLGMVYYRDGDFSKSKQTVLPIVMEYQKVPFVHELVSCFNLIGVMLFL